MQTTLAIFALVLIASSVALPPVLPGLQICPALPSNRTVKHLSGAPSAASCAKLPNEVYLAKGPGCQQTCFDLATCCSTPQPVSGCFCLPGYARSNLGDCIPISTWECFGEISIWGVLYNLLF